MSAVWNHFAEEGRWYFSDTMMQAGRNGLHHRENPEMELLHSFNVAAVVPLDRNASENARPWPA